MKLWFMYDRLNYAFYYSPIYHKAPATSVPMDMKLPERFFNIYIYRKSCQIYRA